MVRTGSIRAGSPSQRSRPFLRTPVFCPPGATTRTELKTVFITGATGFVGSHTARLFIQNGWQVRALVRRPDKPGLLPEGATAVAGGLADAASYRAALEGCDAVVHIAGLVKARTFREYLAVNADGAQAVARAAAEVCPSAMFVHVSSQAAAGPARGGVAVRETDIPAPVSWYGKSKLQGEQAVAQVLRGPWCVVRPTVVYGPGDPGILELFKPIQSGFAPIVAGGRARVQLIDVADLARILYAAAIRPDLTGRHGFAGNDVATMGSLVSYIASLRTSPPWKVPIPAALLRVAGYWETLRQWVTRRARPFNHDKARDMLQADWICDANPWLNDLGIDNMRPWQEGIHALCRCYVRAGWLQPNVWTV